MKKLIIAYLFTITNVFAAPPTYFNGELQTNTYVQNIKAPNYQTTPLGGIDRRLETGNLNELQNPNFEHSTVGTGWTISNATVSGNTANPLEGKKSISLALTGALSLSQSSTINAAQKSGVQMVASIWVNSSDVSDLQLCSLKNGSEDKCTVTGGYVQGSGWRQLTVSFLGDSTSNGLKLKSTDTTGTVLVDQAYVGIGSPVVDFTPDMVYSAQVSSTGVVSGENTDFINGNCMVSSTAIYDCPISIQISDKLNCVPQVDSPNNDGAMAVYERTASSTTNLRFHTKIAQGSGGLIARAFGFVCQKQGADYKTSKAYVASSSDTDWASCGHTTSDFTGFGTVTGIETQCKREGSDLLMRGKFTTGTPTATEARINLKLNGSALTSASTPTIASLQVAGDAVRNVAQTGSFKMLIEPSVAHFTMSLWDGSNSGLSKANGSTLVSASNFVSFVARAPIQGWTDSGVIVGSFQGYNETPGTSRVETFSVSYGTTNATTVCSASPCSYLDQIGNTVTSVTRSGAGVYALNTTKTYAKLKCNINARSVAYSTTGPIRCENCSSVTFGTDNTGGSATDSWGTLLCQGIPQ